MSISCYDYAVKYLSRYPQTEKWLRMQLRKKWYEEQEADDALIMLKQHAMIDDAQYTELYIGSELIRKGKPLYVVKSKLLQKGIDRDLLQDILAQHENAVSEGMSTKIRQEIKKHIIKDLDVYSIMAKLSRKWYPTDIVKKIMKEFDK